jgi:hypothetical protein
MKKESGAGHFQITIKVPRKGTEREKQVLLEIVSRNLGPVLCGEDFRQKYERACFEKLSSSDSKRRAFNFVRQWYNLTTLAREARDTVKSKELKALAAPLMDALGKRDAEFFKGLAEAMRILEQREISSKTKYPGNLDKWLLEYAIENGWDASAHCARIQKTNRLKILEHLD